MTNIKWLTPSRWLRAAVGAPGAAFAAAALGGVALLGTARAGGADPAALATARVAVEEQDANVAKATLSVAAEPDKPDGEQKTTPGTATPSPKKPVVKTGTFHLGIQITTLPEALRSQLQLKHGVLIERVLPDGPAAKAGLKPHDILVAACQTPIHQPEDILHVLRQADGKPLSLQIVRQGQPQTIEVTPEPATDARPEGWWGAFPPKTPFPPGALGGPMPPDFKQWPEYKQLEEALERFRSKIGRDGVGLWFARPGLVVTPGKFDFFWGTSDQAPAKLQRRLSAEFPDGVTIEIVRDEPQPAKIHVQRGDQSWDVAEDRLHELPKDLVPRVQRLLGMGLGWRLPVTVRVGATPEKSEKQGKSDKTDKVTGKAAAPQEPQGRKEPSASDLQKLLERLEQANQAAQEKMEEAIRQLRNELEELRKAQAAPAKP